MELDFKIKMNEKLYLRDPEGTETGKELIRCSIKLVAEIGYEQFTFKKLAADMKSTEATVYRYFENKHKLLIYLVDWYWAFTEFQLIFRTNHLTNAREKIIMAIAVLVFQDNLTTGFTGLDQHSLYGIAIAEGSKTYLSREVDELNREMLYKPYKDLCSRIAGLFSAYNPRYKYPHSLASSIVEIAHSQYYFMHHLPRLSDFSKTKNPKDIKAFLEGLVFGALDLKK
jgi:AcrR family transcriptional regulator